jgi:hypothetical protein
MDHGQHHDQVDPAVQPLRQYRHFGVQGAYGLVTGSPTVAGSLSQSSTKILLMKPAQPVTKGAYSPCAAPGDS